jgi:hypothetical protein
MQANDPRTSALFSENVANALSSNNPMAVYQLLKTSPIPNNYQSDKASFAPTLGWGKNLRQ